MKKFFNITLIAAGILFFSNSCVKDLDTVPLDKDVVTSAVVFDNPDNYKAILAKLYAGLAVSGQQGAAGMPDISGIDEGFGQYLRAYWYHQELTTEEAVIGWNDQTIKDFHYQTWGSSDVFISAMYYRIFYQISLCNEFIRETTDGKLDDRGVSGQLRTDIEHFRAEARFLRALSYWHALDLFGNIPFVTEQDKVGAFFPEQKNQAFVFDYIESELEAIEPLMVEARQNEYGRADKAAVWTLLAKLQLNAKTYVPDRDYNGYLTKSLTNSEKVAAAGYQLEPDYQHLFLADNHTSKEIIFPINFDGINTLTWGGMTFIIHAAVGGNMSPGDYGIDGGWGGTRTTKALVEKFADNDVRAIFHSDGQNLDIEDISNFNDGYAVGKYKNVNKEGAAGSNLTFVDTDFPMFRLADVYLMIAEAQIRKNGSIDGTALGYINDIRERAGLPDIAGCDLDYILDERARELYWEAQRRTDLIRFDKFTGSDYVWPWKGKVKDGTGTADKYKLFPIPASDIGANPNLVQNTGY